MLIRRSIALMLLVLLAACGAPKSTVTGAQVVSAFKAAGLEAESPTPMTKDDYGLAPFVCQGTRFLIPSLGADAGGRVFVCDKDNERDALKTFYDTLGKNSAALFSWTYTSGPVLVQLNGDLKEDQAKKYQAALMSMK